MIQSVSQLTLRSYRIVRLCELCADSNCNLWLCARFRARRCSLQRRLAAGDAATTSGRVASRLVARLALLAGRAPRLRAPHRSAGGRKYESGLVCARLNETKYRISAPNERMYERLKPIALEQFGAAQMVRA